jgi:hypothetical protein
MDVSADDGQTISVFSAEPGSRSAQALDLLASWTATPDHASTRRRTGPGMQITRSSIDTAKGPADWFTGHAYIDPVAAPAGSSTFAAANVHFTPGQRSA